MIHLIMKIWLSISKLSFMRSYINAIASTVEPTNMHSQQSNKYAF